MINVQLQPFARNLMTAYIGAIAYQNAVLSRAAQQTKKEAATLQRAKQDADMWAEMTFDLTVGMIDKRYNESKDYIRSGGQSGTLRFKKTLTETERHLQMTTEKNMLKARTRYENTVSQYNQRINDRKMRASVKRLDLRKFV
jgi:hypothetical protein